MLSAKEETEGGLRLLESAQGGGSSTGCLATALQLQTAPGPHEEPLFT